MILLYYIIILFKWYNNQFIYTIICPAFVNINPAIKTNIIIKGNNTKIIYGDHHLSHVAYSYYTSNFDRATILSVDGQTILNRTTANGGIAWTAEHKNHGTWVHKWGPMEDTTTIYTDGYGGFDINKTSDNGFIIGTWGGTIIKTDSEFYYDEIIE